MIAEVIPAAYDAEGRKVFRPFDRRKGPRPTFPLGRYVSQTLAIHRHSIEEIREFLQQCKYVSDKELFDKDEYWQPPEDFETRMQGDCEDFAFWTWRQFMELGYDCRVVFGQCGRYGSGHAWVEFFENGKCFIVEPLWRRIGVTLPRLSTLKYRPRFSVSWDGKKLAYYQHREENSRPQIVDIARLLPEYLTIFGLFWLGSPTRIPKLIWNVITRFLKGFRWIGKTRRS